MNRHNDSDDVTHVGLVVAQRVKHGRERAGLTQQELSDRTRELGHEISRVTIAKIEGGAREKPRPADYVRAQNVTVADMLVLAAALDMPPVLMFVPLGEVETVRLGEHAGAEMHPHLMFEWVIGEEAFCRLPDNKATRNEKWSKNAAPIETFRSLRARQNRVQAAKWALERHFDEAETLGRPIADAAVAEAQSTFDRELQALVDVRARMRALDMSLPDLPVEWEARLAHIRLAEPMEGES